MAFVIPKSDKKSLFESKQSDINLPGPGAYQVSDNTKLNEYCAPFNASQHKASCFETAEVKHGPGSYEPKYYKDLNKNNEKNNGYVFASKVSRFDTNIKETNENMGNSVHKRNRSVTYSLSPSERNNFSKQIYEEKLNRSKSMMKEIREKNNEHKVESIKGKKEFIRVVLTNTTNTENIESRYIYKYLNGKTLGPGSYQNIEFCPKSKGASKWSLDKNQRFKTEKSHDPGPSDYQPELNRPKSQNESRNAFSSNKPSSSFASTVIRSHMDTVIYKTNIPIKAAILDDRKIKDNSPGPGTYNTETNKTKASFNYGKMHNFGSCSYEKDFQDEENEIPGPGSYNLNLSSITLNSRNKNKNNTIIKDMRTQIFGKKNRMADNFNKNNSLHRTYYEKRNISSENKMEPCFVQPVEEPKKKRLTKFCSLQERCFSRLGTLCQEERFKNKDNQVKEIGPGEYYNEKANNLGSETILKNGCSAVFQSGTKRVDSNLEKNDQSEIPYYNIVRNDIGFKAQKVKKYLENLKKINVVKTPFYTSSKRFEENNSSLNCIETEETENVEKVENFYSEKAKQQSSSFKSTTKREIFKKEEKPGPGDYEAKMISNGAYQNLEKKSFNKYYGHEEHPERKPNVKNVGGGFQSMSRKGSTSNTKYLKIGN